MPPATPASPLLVGSVGHSRWLEEPAVLRQVRVGACGEVETAGPSLPALHLRDAHVDPSSARVRVLRGVDPTNPFPARHRRDVVPQVLDLLRGSCQSCRKILWHVRLRPVFGGSMSSVAVSPALMPAASLQRVIDPHPVARISVWFEHGLELEAIDRSVYGHLPARGQVLARRLRQPQDRRCVDRGQRGVEANGWLPLCAESQWSYVAARTPASATGSVERNTSEFDRLSTGRNPPRGTASTVRGAWSRRVWPRLGAVTAAQPTSFPPSGGSRSRAAGARFAQAALGGAVGDAP